MDGARLPVSLDKLPLPMPLPLSRPPLEGNRASLLSEGSSVFWLGPDCPSQGTWRVGRIGMGYAVQAPV